jgi:hypothetical protein
MKVIIGLRILMGQAARISEIRNTYKILVGKYEGKKTLRRHSHRRRDDIEILK